jgi:signal transduction histidine kinase/ActR/RegA family two-component response regulator
MLKNIPIRRKLMAIIMLTSSVTLLLTCAAFFIYEFISFRQAEVRQLSTQADIIAANSTAALAFDNQNDAVETLSALKAERHIVAAGLYDKKGALFAKYPADLTADALPPSLQPDGYRFQGASLVGFAPIVQGKNDRLGTLYLRSDGGAITERFRLYGFIVGLVIVLSLLVAYVISSLLERHISRPILSLAGMAKSISDNGDYSVRAPKMGEDEVGVLADSINQMLTRIQHHMEAEEQLIKDKWEADHANEAKSAFLSRMSHELRTPLNAVIGYAQLLEMRSEDPKTLDAAKTILKSGRHLLGLINEVLDLARIEAGKLTLSLEPVPVSSTIAYALELVQPIADERGITIEVESEQCEGVHVQADRQRLVQVLINVLTNATKYNRPTGRVEVRCVEGGDGLQRIEVTDSGFGINSDELCRLFQPFERLGNHTVEGTGLGLALSQSLMGLMGGNLTLVSTGRSGSTFAIELPKTNAPSVQVSVESHRERNGFEKDEKRLRIVYVEDNLSNIQLLESVFEEVGGIDLMPAMLASVGIRLVEDHLPDLVLLDLHLPDKHGIEVLRELRKNSKTAHIPIVVLSADATENQISRLLEEGANAYLTKPIDLPSLFVQLNEVKLKRNKAA